MSIYDRGEATPTNDFRARTAAHAKMAGITTPHFTCVRCGGYKPTAGRKAVTPRHPRDGYFCAGCAG